MSTIKRQLEAQAIESDLYDLAEHCRQSNFTDNEIVAEFEYYLYNLEQNCEISSYSNVWTSHDSKDPHFVVHINISGFVSITSYKFHHNRYHQDIDKAYEYAMGVIQ